MKASKAIDPVVIIAKRAVDYPAQCADFNAIASVGKLMFGLAQVYFIFWVLIPDIGGGGKAAAYPWTAPLDWSGQRPVLRPGTPSKSRRS